MASITGLCAKIINVICFNYMVICQEITPNFNDDPIHASFADFYGSMINTPFFGGYYTTISPLFVVFCVILFAALGLFKYNSKVLEMKASQLLEPNQSINRNQNRQQEQKEQQEEANDVYRESTSWGAKYTQRV